MPARRFAAILRAPADSWHIVRYGCKLFSGFECPEWARPGTKQLWVGFMLSEATFHERPFSSEGVSPADLRKRESDLLLLVYRQMRSLVGPHPDLDDLVQTALEQVLTAKFEGRSRLSTFTHSICFRVWMKHLRSLYRWRSLFSHSDEEPKQRPDASTPLSSIESEERLRHFYRVLDQVSPKRRAVVIYHDISGEDIPTIAAIVGTSEATVRTRLRDGRKRLRELLEGDPYYGRESQEVKEP